MLEQNEPSFFARHQRLLLGFSTLYVIALLISHGTLPQHHVWLIAATLSVAMNFTYIIEAHASRQSERIEILIAASLIGLTLLGAVFAPVLIIFAIFAHGLWDVAKYFGAGVPFLSWYLWGCAIIDWTYAIALMIYWLR